MSTLEVDAIKDKTGTTTLVTLSSSGITYPQGHVIKTSSVFDDNSGTQVVISADATWTEISSGLRLTHQADHASNILLMSFSICFNSPNSNQIYHAKFYNQSGSADITIPTAVGVRIPCHWSKRVTAADSNDMEMLNMSMRHVAGSTSAITYSPYFWTNSPDIDFFLSDLNNDEGQVQGGTFIIMEIQA